jgi:4-amino-4-deoxy-L-arabinose transferase-like glycosyltransferase
MRATSLPATLRPALGPVSVAIVAGLLLAPFAAIDPARGVTFSNAPFSDEAWNLIGARNLVLFGHPSTDEWRTWLLTIPFTAIQTAALTVFGLDLVVARLVVIATVALTGAVIAAGLGPAIGSLRAWIAGVAYVTSALVLYYGRLAFLEPMVGAFLAIGVVSVVPAGRGRALQWGVVGGLALALAVMTKAVAVAASGAIVAVVALAAFRHAWARRWTLGALLSAGVVAMAWGGLVLWPRREEVATVVGVIYPPFGFPRDLAELVRQLGVFPLEDGVLPLTAPLLVLAILGIARTARRARAERIARRIGDPPVEASVEAPPGWWILPVAAFAALAVSVLLMGIVTYQPNRYAVAFLPLAAIVGGWALPDRLTVPDRSTRAVAGLIVLAISVQGVVLQAYWVRHGGDELARIQPAAAAIPPGASVAGQYAPLVAFREPVRAIVPFETVNDGDLYELGVRYVIWTDGGPAWTALHPEAWAARRTLGCMTWGIGVVRSCLYALP